MENKMPEIKAKVEDMIFLPLQQTEGAAGYDLRCNLNTEFIELLPNKVYMIDTGVALEIPEGYHGKISCRSSIGKKGIIIPNSPAIIDSDYRDNIKVLLVNINEHILEIKDKSRIAQIIIEKNYDFKWNIVDELTPSARGKGGFGSTGEK